VDEDYERLLRGQLRGGLAEYADTERRLVAALTRDCRRFVVGYAVREEHFNEAYPPGAEKQMFKQDFFWMAKNRERILQEWNKRYSGKPTR